MKTTPVTILTRDREQQTAQGADKPSKTYRWAYIPVDPTTGICHDVDANFFKTKKAADGRRRLLSATVAVVGDVWNL